MPEESTPDLTAAMDRAVLALTAAATAVAALPEGADRTQPLRALATLLVGSPDTLRQQALRLCPALATAEPIPDAHLQPAELAIVSRLEASSIEAIDRTLLASATPRWQPARRVVGDALITLNDQFPGLPLGFYMQRVAALVHGGVLAARGDLAFMRLCELRLADLPHGVAHGFALAPRG